MTGAIDNLEALAVDIEKDRGPLDLLALFQRAGQDDWELVFAAPWAEASRRDAIGYVGDKAARHFTPEQASAIKSVVPLFTATAVLSLRFGGPGEYRGFELNDVEVARAIIARLRPPPARKARPYESPDPDASSGAPGTFSAAGASFSFTSAGKP